MGQRRVDARRAVALAVEYALRHPHLRPSVRATPVASLIETCKATQFNPERCTLALNIPHRNTIPPHQPQYALGRVETLLRAGYYNAGSCIRALNLEYGGAGLVWDIRLNDFFVACTAVRKHPFGKFPARLVLDVAAMRPVGGNHVSRDNAVQKTRVRVPVKLVRVGPDSVTAREICQLAEIFGMRLFEPRDQTGPTRIAFFSHHKTVPPAFQSTWQPFRPGFR